jgi:signal transduction histidine kinase
MTTEMPPATDAAAQLAQLRADVAKTAHDLSNVLGAVLNYSTFLSEDLAPSEAAREYLPHLESAARRALQLVDRLNP